VAGALSQQARRLLFAPDEHCGWHIRDPGAPPLTPELDVVPAPSDRAQLAAAHQRWRQAVEASARQQAVKHDAIPVWFPVPSTSRYAIVNVYGGGPRDWSAFVTTFGASLLGSGNRVTALNLSERPAADELARLAQQAGYVVRSDSVSGRGSSIDLFAKLDAEGLINFVLDVLKTGEARAERTERLEARQTLREVARVLTEPVTPARLAIGLRAVLREDVPHGLGHALSNAEYRALTQLYGDEIRQLRSRLERLERLETTVSAIAEFGMIPTPARPASKAPFDLRLIQVARDSEELDFDLGGTLLARAILRRVRQTPAPRRPETLIIIGADALDERSIRSLADAAELGKLRLVLLFDRLRDVAESIRGVANSCSIFMKMQHDKDATTASNFIGSDYKFVINGVTLTEGDSREWSDTFSTTSSTSVDRGTSTSWSFGAQFGRTVSRSLSRSRSHSTGTSQTTGGGANSSRAVQAGRVYERIVEPHQVQGLVEMAMLIVETDGRRVTLAFCDPGIAERRRVAERPLPR